MSIVDEEDVIFSELEKQMPTIIRDGVADESEYLSARYKILYVLKEVNGGESWDLRQFIREGGRPQTWDNIARWTEAILNWDTGQMSWNELDKSKEDNEQRRKNMLKKIAAINLKKTSGGYTADGKVISSAAKANKCIIRKQLDIYNPDIIVCCGTDGDFVEACYSDAKIEWKSTSRGIWYFIHDGKVIISFTHPEARVKDAILYYSFYDAIREILLERNNPQKY